MTNSTKSSFNLDVNTIGDKVKELIHEGNVRRLIVKRGDEVIAEFPLTAAVVGTVIAPILAAIGAIAALVTECTIEVEHIGDGNDGKAAS